MYGLAAWRGDTPDSEAWLPGIFLLGMAAMFLTVLALVGPTGRRTRALCPGAILAGVGALFSLAGSGVIRCVAPVPVIVGSVTWVLAGYRGLSWTAVIVLTVVGVYDYIASQTVQGRHMYAIGGNPEAAELSGVNVKRLTIIVFASMGLLSALSGILFTSRLRSATTTAGTLFEPDGH